VVVCDADTLKELFVTNSDSTRHRKMTPTLRSVYQPIGIDDGLGLVLSRDNFAKRHAQAIVLLSDNDRFISIVKKVALELVDAVPLGGFVRGLKHLTMNVMTQYLTGNELGWDEFIRIDAKFDSFNKKLLTSAKDVFPWLNLIPFYSAFSNQAIQTEATQILAFLKGLCWRAKEGTFGHSIRNEDDPVKQQEDLFLMFDLFFAGAETTYVAFNWIVMFMIKYPNVQNKLYGYLKDDNEKMGITAMRGVVREVLTFRPPAPFGIPHQADQDIELKEAGVTIPAGYMIIQDLWTIQQRIMDGEHFNPFCSSKDEKWGAVFGYGPRTCIGRKLAIQELNIVCKELFLNYEITSREDIDLTPRPDSMLSLQFHPYTPVLTRRT
jgi:hypothetical protein